MLVFKWITSYIIMKLLRILFKYAKNMVILMSIDYIFKIYAFRRNTQYLSIWLNFYEFLAFDAILT
jgi:hypothetical protein